MNALVVVFPLACTFSVCAFIRVPVRVSAALCAWHLVWSPHLAPGVQVVVRLRRVDLGEQEAGLRAAVLRVHVAWHGEAALQELLRVVQWRLQQLLEVLVLRQVLVTRLSPLGDGLKRGGHETR